MLFCQLLFFILFILLYFMISRVFCVQLLPIKHQISDRLLFKFSYPYTTFLGNEDNTVCFGGHVLRFDEVLQSHGKPMF